MRSRAIGPALGLVAVFFGGLLLKGAVPAVPTGQWLAGAPVSHLRTGAVAVALADGRVALIGGRGADGAPTDAVEIVGTDGSITPGAPLSTPRTGHAAVRLPDGSVLVIGGTTLVASDTGAVEAATATSEVYFPGANLWTPAASLAVARTGLTATSITDGRVLVAGGTGDAGALDSLEVYDPTATTFHTLGVMTSPRAEQAAAVAGATSVLVVGGKSGSTVLATADLIDLDSGTVVPVTLNTARAGASATSLLDGRVFVAGGSDGTTELASAEIVDPATGFSAAAPTAMASARRDQQAIRLEHNATVILVGGTAGGAVVPTVEQFVPWTGEFRSANPERMPRTGVAVAHTATDGVLVAAGGKAADGSLATQSELYGFATLYADKDDYAPGQFVTITGHGWQPGETVHMVLKETGPNPDPDVPLDAIADGDGNITNDVWAPDEHDIGMRFYLIASGAASTAQLTFTDGNVTAVSGMAILNASGGNNSATPCASGSPGSFVLNSVYCGQATVTGITGGGTSSFFERWLSPSNAPVCSATISATLNTTYALNCALNATGTWTFQACSNANCNGSNLLGSMTATVSADTVPPTTTITLSPSAANGNNGWYTSNVHVTASAADNSGGSGVAETRCVVDPAIAPANFDALPASCSLLGAGGDVPTDGMHVVYAASRDTANNKESPVKTASFKIDKTAPTITFQSQSPSANGNGWNNSDVTVTWTCTDLGSGAVVESVSQTVSTNGSNQSTTGTCTDLAGNTASLSQNGINIDKVAPTITYQSQSPVANANGWNNTNVTLSWTCTDSGSGPVTSPVTQTISSEGTHQSATGTCQDLAGNTASHTDGDVNVDKSAPNAPTGQESPNANGNGWHNTSPVAVSFTANGDNGLSGIDYCTTSSNVSGETAGTGVNGTCTDKAGNVSPQATVTVRIDLTKPVITGSRTPDPNTNGWNNTNVTVSFVCAESGSVQSGLGTNTVSGATLSSDGANQSVTNGGVCQDLAGNAADSATISGINIDKSAPNAPTGHESPGANANGWHNTSPVAVSFTMNGDNGPSGIDFCTTGSNVSGETAGTDVDGTCTDRAGNVSPQTTVTVRIDLTKPVITGSRTPDANANGWNNTSVTVSFVCADSGTIQSGLGANTVAGATLSSDGASQSVTNTGVCEDLAGNVADSATINGINLDKSAPNAPTGHESPGANANGWHNTSPVGVSFVANGDNGPSGIDFCTTGSNVTGETSGTDVHGTCTDKAGNVSPQTTVTVRIDLTKPTITASRAPNANANGWNNTNVTVSFVCADNGGVQSGIGTNTVAGATLSSDGANQSVTNTGVCEDLAGNAGDSATLNGINIDKSAPNAPAGHESPGANANGWHNTSPVGVSFTMNGDNGPSGIDFCTPSSNVSGETAGTDVNGTCTDKAGNVSPQTTVTVRIDLTKPVITPGRTPAANANGWNNTNVTVSFVCADTGGVQSGLGTNTVAGATVSSEGGNQSATNTGACEDLAGNSADSVTVNGINIDKTAPTISGSRLPAANAYGWNNVDVTVSFTCSDGLSGLAAGSPPSPTTLTTEGAEQSVPGTCTDKAGNPASTTVSGINIDKTKPTITITVPANGASYVLNQIVASNYVCSDSLSAIATCTGPVANGANLDTSTGSHSFTVTATDKAGNVATPVTNTYVAQFAFTGFFAPVDNLPVINKANAGQAIPVKWRATDVNGVGVSDPSSFVSLTVYPVSCGAWSALPADPLPTDQTSTSGLLYQGNGNWQFNWKTPKQYANQCLVARVTLGDNTTHDFDVSFK